MKANVMTSRLAAALVWLIVFESNTSAAGPLDPRQLQFAYPGRRASVAGLQLLAFGNGRFVGISLAYKDSLISEDGLHWVAATNAFQGSVIGMTFGRGLFVAAGEQGKIWTSEDGLAWAERESGVSDPFSSVAAGLDRFVALGGQSVAVSSSGIDWTAGKFPVKSSSAQIAFGAGKFAAIAGSAIYTSVDGLNWERRESGTTNLLSTIDFVKDAFFATDQRSGLVRSTDGVNWSATVRAAVVPMFFGGGVWLASENNSDLLASVDGQIWTRLGLDFRGIRFRGPPKIAYGNNRFVAAPFDSILISEDGSLWSYLGIDWNVFPLDAQPGVAFGNGHFIMAGNPGGYRNPFPVLRSTNGLAWTRLELPGAGNYPFAALSSLDRGLDWAHFRASSVTFGADRFVSVAPAPYNSTFLTVISDAERWNGVLSGKTLMSVAFGQSQFVAVGDSGTVARSADGKIWVQSQSGATNDLRAIAFGDGQFVAVGRQGTLLRSTNAVDWTGTSAGTNLELRAVAFGNGLWMAVGDGMVTSPDGLIWKKAELPALHFTSLVFGNGGFAAASDTGILVLTSDGEQFSQVRLGNFPIWSAAYGNGAFVFIGPNVLRADVTHPALMANRSAGGIELALMGELGRSYAVQANSKLLGTNWTHLGAVTLSQLPMSFTDSAGASRPMRFYRAVLEP